MSAKRKRNSPVETLAFIAMARRIIAAAGRRAADADEFELWELASLRDDIEAAIKVAVDGQRRIGRSWQHIGDALDITRQAAQQRYGDKEKKA